MSMIPGPTGTAASFPDGIIGSQRANVQTISATLVLTSASNRLQLITPSGATRTVQLPTTGVLQGEEWILMNAAGSGQSLIVAASNGSTIITLAPGESGRVVASVAAPVASSDWQTQVQGITLADGSVSVPSLRFTGASVDTGLYSPGTDQIAFSQNGVQTLLATAAGAFTLGPNAANVTHSILGKASTTDTGADRVNNPMVYFGSNSSQLGYLALGYSQNTNRLYFAAFGNGAGINDGFEFWSEPSWGSFEQIAVATGPGAWTFGSATQSTAHLLRGSATGGYTPLTLINLSTGEVNLDFNRNGANRWQLSVATNNNFTFYDFGIASAAGRITAGSGAWNIGTGGNTSRWNAQQVVITRSAGIDTALTSISGSIPLGYSGSGYAATGYNFQHTGTTNTIYREGSDSVSILTYGAAVGTAGNACFSFHALASGGSAGNVALVSGNIQAYVVLGGAWFQGNNSASWSVVSDVRIKKNIRPIANALDKVCGLDPIHFEYITDDHLPGVRTGYKAQSVQMVLPGHVAETVPSALDQELVGADEKILTVDPDFLPYVVKAIIELKAKNDALEERLAALES